MKSKRILFTDIGKAELLTEEHRVPNADEVVVKLAVSTISSGTERANLNGSTTIAWDKPEAEKAIFPRSCGYSSAGTVIEVGSDVKTLKVGDRVALSWSHNMQYLTINEKRAYKIDDVSFYDAAMFHIGIFPLAAIRKCRLEIGESAIVMGLGILGMVALQLLKAAGAVPIIAVDPMADKRKKALKCGADYALNPYAPDFAETVKRLTNGGANVGIEVTGIGAGLNGILDCMARFGRVALLGCTRNSDFSVDYYRKVHGPGITLVGAHTMARPANESSNGFWTQRDDVLTLKRLTEAGRINLSGMIDEVHSPAAAPEIYTRLSKDSSFPLVQFDWSRLE